MSGLVTAGGSLAKLLLFALVTAEILCQAGASVRQLWRIKQEEPGLAGLSLLLGWIATGSLFLGLAFTGLFRIPAIAAAMLIPALAGMLTRRALILPRLATGWGGRLPPESILAAALAVPVVISWIGPVMEVDAFIYHLAVPAQYLAAGKAVFENAGVNFLLPLPTEMVYVVPLVLGDERLARWMTGLLFAAAAGLFVSWRNRPALFLGIAFVLALNQTGFLLTRVKSDAPAALLLLAGAGMAVRGPVSASLGALLFGAAGAAKGSCLPLVAVWILFHGRYLRHRLATAASLAAPLIPWAIKSWLVLGNPIFPLFYAIIPTKGFSELNLPLQAAFFQPWTDPAARGLLSLPLASVSFLFSEHAVLPLAAAGCLVFGKNRRAILAALLGGAAILYFTQIPRFAVPAAMLLAFLAGRDLAGFRLLSLQAWRIAAAAAVAAGFLLRPAPPSFDLAGLGLEEGRRRALGELLELSRFSDANFPGRPVMLAGDPRSFPFAQRIVSAGALYETPLIWKTVRESPDSSRLRTRFRQLGARAIIYNFVGGLGGAGRAWPGTWEARDLSLYREFVGRYFEVARPPALVDQLGGGFYVFRILSRPRATPARAVYHLPGIESVFAQADEQLRLFDRPAEALKRYRALGRLLPGTGVVAEKIAYVHYRKGRHREALEALRPYTNAGWVGELNLLIHGSCALALGRNKEAARSLHRALELYPAHRDAITADLARIGKDSGQAKRPAR